MPGEISRLLREERASFGGADTFKFYFPHYGPFSDSTFTTLKILEILAMQNVPLSALVRSFPRTVHAYKTIPLPKDKVKTFPDDLKRKLRLITDANLDYQDIILGVKIVLKDKGWITLIPSILSDTVDLTAEGKTPQNSEELIEYVDKIIKEII
jgi:phosphomannomutase